MFRASATNGRGFTGVFWPRPPRELGAIIEIASSRLVFRPQLPEPIEFIMKNFCLRTKN